MLVIFQLLANIADATENEGGFVFKGSVSHFMDPINHCVVIYTSAKGVQDILPF